MQAANNTLSRCPVCYHPMPTPAHVFLHEQQHGAQAHLPMALYDRVAWLMQAYADSLTAKGEV